MTIIRYDRFAPTPPSTPLVFRHVGALGLAGLLMAGCATGAAGHDENPGATRQTSSAITEWPVARVTAPKFSDQVETLGLRTIKLEARKPACSEITGLVGYDKWKSICESPVGGAFNPPVVDLVIPDASPLMKFWHLSDPAAPSRYSFLLPPLSKGGFTVWLDSLVTKSLDLALTETGIRLTFSLGGHATTAGGPVNPELDLENVTLVVDLMQPKDAWGPKPLLAIDRIDVVDLSFKVHDCGLAGWCSGVVDDVAHMFDAFLIAELKSELPKVFNPMLAKPAFWDAFVAIFKLMAELIAPPVALTSLPALSPFEIAARTHRVVPPVAPSCRVLRICGGSRVKCDVQASPEQQEDAKLLQVPAPGGSYVTVEKVTVPFLGDDWAKYRWDTIHAPPFRVCTSNELGTACGPEILPVVCGPDVPAALCDDEEPCGDPSIRIYETLPPWELITFKPGEDPFIGDVLCFPGDDRFIALRMPDDVHAELWLWGMGAHMSMMDEFGHQLGDGYLSDQNQPGFELLSLPNLSPGSLVLVRVSQVGQGQGPVEFQLGINGTQQ